MDRVTEALDCGVIRPENDGLRVIGKLALWFGIYSGQIKICPHHAQ